MGGILEDIKAQLDRIELRLAKCEEPESGEWVDQRQSPLGRRRHCTVVRRLVGENDPNAVIVGRKHLLRRDTLDGELARMSLPPSPAPANDDAYARVMSRALALEGKPR